MTKEKKFTVELQDVLDWMDNEENTYAMCSHSPNKRLTCTMHGTLKVYHNNKVVFESINAIEAVKKFNTITK